MLLESSELQEFLVEFDPNQGRMIASDFARRPAVMPDKLRLIDPRLFGPGVYILLRKGETLYIGSSMRLMVRLSGHWFSRQKKFIFDEIRVILCTTKEDLRLMEKAAAAKYKPQFNHGTGYQTEKFTFGELGIDIKKLIKENPAVVHLKKDRSPWRRV